MQQTIYLFRHGEVHAKKNVLMGWLNLPLSTQGVRQAKELAKKLKKENISIGFCSDLLRGQQVLVEVLKYHPKAKVIIDHRLRERHYGAISGQLESVFADTSILENGLNGRIVEKIPGMESMAVVRNRVFPFMTQLLHFMQKEKVNVAISAHKNSLELIQEYLEGLTPDQAKKLEHFPTNYKKYVITFD
ncbi:MAG: histidine phosphatase family protein [archaeon]|jgi:broad specificity phosphatase PhoE